MPLSERLKVAKDFLRGRKTPSRPPTPVPQAETPPAHTQTQPDAIQTQVDTPATQPASTLSFERASLATSPGGDTSSISPSAMTSSAKDPPTVGTKSTRTKDSVVDNVALAVDVVEKLAGFVQTVPFIAPVAGCLSQIIKVYKKVEATDEKRDTLLHRIVSISHDLHATVLWMEAAGHVDVLTRLKPDLETYADLLEKAAAFVADYNEIGAVRHGAARNQLGGDFSTLQQDLDLFGARFRTNRLVDLSIQQNQMNGALDQVHDAVTVEKLETWLCSPPDMKQKQHDMQALRQEGTGEWFLEGNEFVYWQDHPGSLWIQGSSGAGKSVLSSAAITQLIHDKPLFKDRGKSAAVAFFYFDFKDKTDHAVECALRCIVLQLSAQSRRHYEILSAQYNLSDGQTLPTYHDLQCILEELLRQLERTYIIFDGLDECVDNEQVQIITLISRLQKWTESPLHLLFTSQPRTVFSDGFKDVTCIYMESDVMQKDIRLFVEAELCKMKTWSSRIDEIADQVVSKSNGMFRFAACILIELSRCKWQNELNRAIENLPTDLFGVYDQFIQRIRTDDFVYVAAIFRWLLFGVRTRHNSIDTLETLADAVSFDFSNPTHHTYDPTLRNVHANTIPEWLEGLVTVLADGRGQLALAHPSIQDYLLSAPFTEKFECDLSLGPSHTFLAQSCIGCLLHFADHPFNQSTSYPLAKYAANWWCHHLLRSQDRAVLFVDAMRLLENGSEQYNTLILLRINLLWEGLSPLELCAEEGYVEGVCALLENGADMGGALLSAATGGHVAMVRLLLEKGANIDLQDAERATALHTASTVGHAEIVRLLLERGAGVNIYDSRDETALHRAAQRDHVEVVRLLLERGADINAHAEQASTALQAAARGGNIEVIRLLLEKGADINAQGGRYGSALHGASSYGNIELVRFLLQNGADITAHNERHGTVLGAASSNGHVEIVRLLLEHGAELNAHDEEHGTALHGAAERDHVEVVRLLLERGADINARAEQTSTALQGYGPALYEPASVATSIIYWPDDSTGFSDLETDFPPELTVGLEEFMRDHPNSGAFVSVHQPSKPLAWLEHNYDLPLLEHIRKTGVLSGPIPTQLFPEVSALGIFGPLRDPKTTELAQALADTSKFPVIARPSANDPILRFKTTVATENSRGFEQLFSTAPIVVMSAQIDGGNGAAGDGNRQGQPTGGGNDPDGRGHGHGPPAGGGEDPEGPPDGGHDPDGNGDGGGGGGDPDGEGTGTGVDDDNWVDWASPVHRAKLTVNMDFTVSNSAPEKLTVPMEIICQTQFKTHAAKSVVLHPKQKEEEQAADEAQAEVHTILKVQFKPDRVALETSFTVLGFLTDRPRSIFDSTALDVGFSEPGQIIKHVSGKTRQDNFGLTGGIAGAGHSPTALLNYQHNRGTTETVEAQNNKIMKPVKVLHRMGDLCELNGRSYASCNFSYEVRLDPVTGKKISLPSLSVPFAFGTNFWNTDVEGTLVHPPHVSSVNRHQIFIWVFNPQAKIQIQGFVLVFSTIVSDIRRKRQIEWDTSFKIDAESGIPSEPELSRRPHEKASFFVGTAPLHQSEDKHFSFQNIQQGIKGLFNRGKSPRLKPPPPVTLTPQPIASIGWDNTYAQWRDPVYPKLDKCFRPPEQGGSSLVAYAIGSFPE